MSQDKHKGEIRCGGGSNSGDVAGFFHFFTTFAPIILLSKSLLKKVSLLVSWFFPEIFCLGVVQWHAL